MARRLDAQRRVAREPPSAPARQVGAEQRHDDQQQADRPSRPPALRLGGELVIRSGLFEESSEPGQLVSGSILYPAFWQGQGQRCYTFLRNIRFRSPPRLAS